MNSLANTIYLIENIASQQRGIFTINDLKKFFETYDSSHLSRKIKPLIEAKFLFKFMRGIYVTKDFNINFLSKRLYPNSVISLATVLADELIIGSVPDKTVYALKLGASKTIKSPLGNLYYFGLSDIKLLTLGVYFKKGLSYADREKAFIDTLYFYQSGHSFYFNIYSDLNLDILDKNKIMQYLTNYRNPKFVSFVKGVLNESY
jgi:hypothetical protein